MAVIAVVEIALRNAVDDTVRDYFGSDAWLAAPPVPFRWKNQENQKVTEALTQARRVTYAKLTNDQKKELDHEAFPTGLPSTIPREARVKARQKRIETRRGQVIAQLTIFFWKRMFPPDHEATLWKPALKRWFPDKRVSRSDVAERLEVIYQMRNRVAHHEVTLADRIVPFAEVTDWIAERFLTKNASRSTPLVELLGPSRADLDQKAVAVRQLTETD